MTRIALVSPFTLPSLCGNSFLAERLREGLLRRGHAVSLFNSGRDAPREAVAFRPHLLHSLNADRPHAWLQAVRRDLSAPWVITLTGTDYNSWCGAGDPPLHVRESLERARKLVVFHQEALDTLKECLPSVGQKIAVIPQGVKPFGEDADRQALRTSFGFPPGEVVFLMVSSIRPVKNVGAALEAFGEVRRTIPQARLVLAGPVLESREADRIFALGKRLKGFSYLGEKSPLEVRKLMRAADVFLNTSLSEGMSGSMLEAMSEGLPVLASSVAGNRSLVSDGVNGLFFAVDRRTDLVNQAARLSTDQLLRRRLGKAGKQVAATRHSVERELDLHQKLYEQVLSAEPSRSSQP